jgi:hypothetical protein
MQLVNAVPTIPAQAFAPGRPCGPGSDGEFMGTGVGGATMGEVGCGNGEG